MSIASQLFDDHSQLSKDAPVGKKIFGEKVRFCIENLWMVMMFALFIALGPFAAIAVLPAILSLAKHQKDAPMPESVVCDA